MFKLNRKWAIIGTDDTAYEFAKRIRASADGKIVAVYADDHVAAIYFAKKVGAGLYHSEFENILSDDKIDSVYITQIDSSNEEAVFKLLESGKNVIYDRISTSEKNTEIFITRCEDSRYI